MSLLTKITTDYSPPEDRIRLSGQDKSGHIQHLWITRRLTDLLIVSLLDWLNKQNSAFVNADLIQTFEQEKATSALTPQERVPESQEIEDPSWLALSIDVTKGEDGILLVFKGEGSKTASFAFGVIELRQWLTICRRIYETAGWQLAAWPNWITPQNESGDFPNAVHLH